MDNILLSRFVSANGTPLDFRQFISDNVSELVFFSGSRHEPISIYTQDVEPMEASVDTDQVESVSECL